MDFWLYIIIGILLVTIIILCVLLVTQRKSICRIETELSDIIATDTNNLISVSSNDKYIKELAVELNSQLKELRRERRRLRTGDSELKGAITNITHDLRTPLTAISGYLDLLDGEEKSEEVEKYLVVIRERTQALKNLCEELFRYSVITSTSDEMKIEEVNLNGILEESIAGFYGMLIANGITPEIVIPEKPVNKSLDRTATLRIFGNIINNAVKYSDGDLSIELQESGKITFSNSAKNLSNIQVGKLFDRFYTVESAKNSTGLGLSIAKLLTKKMGGRITADYNNSRLSITIDWEANE